MIGGTAGDDLKFNKTYQIYQDKVLSAHVLLGVISHKKRFEILYGHGYEPTEYYARVTKAKGNIIYELDGKPAYDVYQEMITKFQEFHWTMLRTMHLVILKISTLKYYILWVFKMPMEIIEFYS